MENTEWARFVKDSFASGRATHAWAVEAEQAVLSDLLKLFSAYAVSHGGASEKDYRLALKARHPDVFYYPSADRKTMAVEDVKDLVAQAQKPPTMSRSKAYVLNASNYSQAQNWQGKLLKILEEPPAGSYIFIGTSNAGELLDTVKSRCAFVAQGRTGFFEIKEFLVQRGYNARSAEIAAFLSGGSVNSAIELIGGNIAEGLFYAVLDTLKNMTGTRVSLSYVAELAKYRDNYKLLLTAFESFFAEIIRFGQGSPYLSQTEEIAAAANNYSPEAAARSIELVEGSYTKLNSRVNFNMAFDNLILKILEVRYRCPK